jgi:FdhD protein
MPSELTEAEVQRVTAGSEPERFADVLAVEEPLEIRVGIRTNGKFEHRVISITMRTPGNDPELAAGFLFTEGILRSPDQIKEIKHCGKSSPAATASRSEPGAIATGFFLPVVSLQPHTNTVRVDLHQGVDVDFKKLERNFYTTSSCGVCGKSSIEALHTGAKRIETDGFRPIDPELIHSLPDALLAAQYAFEKTGGLHASVIFNRDGSVDTICEDVGRHNALDKAIGRKFLADEVPLSDRVLMVSGRASFELVQKALMAGIPVLAAVGAPSSLAVDLAKEFNMTLIGFVRGERFNIYSGAERIASQHQDKRGGPTGQNHLRKRVGSSQEG